MQSRPTTSNASTLQEYSLISQEVLCQNKPYIFLHRITLRHTYRKRQAARLEGKDAGAGEGLNVVAEYGARGSHDGLTVWSRGYRGYRGHGSRRVHGRRGNRGWPRYATNGSDSHVVQSPGLLMDTEYYELIERGMKGSRHHCIALCQLGLERLGRTPWQQK